MNSHKARYRRRHQAAKRDPFEWTGDVVVPVYRCAVSRTKKGALLRRREEKLERRTKP